MQKVKIIYTILRSNKEAILEIHKIFAALISCVQPNKFLKKLTKCICLESKPLMLTREKNRCSILYSTSFI